MAADKPLLATLTRRVHLAIRKRILADVRAAGFNDLTPAHLYVFQIPGPDGLRPTELAQRMNMTKQATHHLLETLEARGYIERSAEDADGRVRIIRLTARGTAVMRSMHKSMRAAEKEWAEQVGARELERIRRGLQHLDGIVSYDDGATP